MTDSIFYLIVFFLPIFLSICFSQTSKNKNIFKERTPLNNKNTGHLVGGWALTLTLFLCYSFFENLPGETQNLLSAPLFFSSFFFLGLIDDVRGMGAAQKLLYQTSILLICISGLTTDFSEIFVLLFFGLTLINGFNFIDGINGLLPMLCSVLFFQIKGGTLLSVMVLGFFCVSRRNKKIYLGDSGSLLLGSIAFWTVAGNSSKLNFLTTDPKSIFLFFLIPIADVFWATIRRCTFRPGEKKTLSSFFTKISNPDERHIHHLLKRNYGERTTIILLALTTWAATEFSIFLNSTTL